MSGQKNEESSVLELTRQLISPSDLIFGPPLTTEAAEKIFDSIFASAPGNGEIENHFSSRIGRHVLIHEH